MTETGFFFQTLSLLGHKYVESEKMSLVVMVTVVIKIAIMHRVIWLVSRMPLAFRMTKENLSKRFKMKFYYFFFGPLYC